ncbi:MAG: LytR/AlgR family response regulator transcription factor [Flavobacteriales bacterium]
MKTYSIAIIDDEQENIDVLTDYIEIYCSRLVLDRTFTDLDLAVDYLQNSPPDLLFLDINFGDRSIFEILDIVKPKHSKIIFVSAFEAHALKSIEYMPTGFLVKPINKTKLITEVSKAISILESENHFDKTTNDNTLGKLKIKGASSIDIFEIKDIIYAEADGRYTTFHLQNGRQVVCTKNLGSYSDVLPESHFIRIHAKYLVAIHTIISIQRGTKPNCMLTNGTKLNVSRRRLDELIEKIDRI